jgi:flagellar M-ring protein FliF
MDNLTALVKSAIGFDANRGDQVEVVNMRFMDLEEMVEGERLWLGFTKAEIFRLAEGFSVSLVAVIVIMMVVRPLISKAFGAVADETVDENLLLAQTGPQLLGPGMQNVQAVEEQTMELDELIDIAKVEGRVKASSLRKIGEIVDKHPEEALNILRSWLYREGGN